jgi:BirA family biotin operon repressor/biotin-[acetyl-CoA-carboxylase] ligase
VNDPLEEWRLNAEHIGRRVLVFNEVDSTNTRAAALGLADGDAVLAFHQTAGRGRFGRIWCSRPGASILLSVALAPPLELRRPSILTAWAAVAVGDAIYALTGLQACIKWPNDLLVRGKKICGILIEQGPATIVGIGLNLNQTEDEFKTAGLPLATSIALAAGTAIEHRTAAETVLRHLDSEYARLLSSEWAAVQAEWKWRTGLLGQRVVVELSDGSRLTGRLHDMSFDALDLELPDGSRQAIVPERVEHVSLRSEGDQAEVRRQ